MRLYGPIGGDPFDPSATAITAEGVARELDGFRSRGVKALDIFLSSPGGNVLEGLAIHAQIQRFPGDVTITVDGVAASVASAIAMAGKRLVMPKPSRMMIHSAWLTFAVIGNAKALREALPKLEKTASDLDKLSSALRDIYASASGLSADRVQKMMDAETWLTADEACALGLCDEVTDPGGQRPKRARASLLDSYRNTPAELRALGTEAALARLEGLLMRQRVTEIAASASAAAAGRKPGAVTMK